MIFENKNIHTTLIQQRIHMTKVYGRTNVTCLPRSRSTYWLVCSGLDLFAFSFWELDFN